MCVWLIYQFQSLWNFRNCVCVSVGCWRGKTIHVAYIIASKLTKPTTKYIKMKLQFFFFSLGIHQFQPIQQASATQHDRTTSRRASLCHP
jgi:hypothetical protein